MNDSLLKVVRIKDCCPEVGKPQENPQTRRKKKKKISGFFLSFSQSQKKKKKLGKNLVKKLGKKKK